MAETPLNVRPVASSSQVTPKAIPSKSLLKPWTFEYAPSPSGKDINLLIMFHGLGDNATPFFNLAKSLNLPHTAILSLQAPLVIPFMETPTHFSWYNTFDPLFNPLLSPDPSKTIAPLRNLLEALTSKEVGWDLTNIHLFGWGQGGTMALELAFSIGQDGILPGGPGPKIEPVADDTTATAGPSKRRRLGSAVSVCGPLLSFPSREVELETPVLYYTRQKPNSAVRTQSETAVKRAFKKVEVVSADPKGGEGMPRGREEWMGIMKFWGEVLGREEGWKGDGEIYEVVP